MADPQTSAQRSSVEALFDQHSARMFRAAYRVTGSMADSEDVLQTVFLRLLRRESLPDLGLSAGSYLHRSAVNAGLDLLRSRRRRAAVPIDEELDDEQSGVLAAVSQPLAEAERAEIRDTLRHAVAQLNERAAEIFALRYFEGYGNTEIARMLGTSRSAVAVTLHRSRERLKHDLSFA